MAIELRCECGAELRLPNEAAGRRARCKQCGKVFQIPDHVITTEVDDALRAAHEEEEEKQLQRVALGGRLTPGLSEEEFLPRGFWADAALIFVKDLHNVITFLFVWVFYTFVIVFAALSISLAMTLFYALAGLLICGIGLGYLCSFWFRVISYTADGDDRWPFVATAEGLWGDVILPALQFLGAWLAVLAPAIAALVAIRATGNFAQFWPVAAMLAACGMFLWPSVMLATALGGFRAAVRLDMHVATAFKAFFPYLAIWGMLLVPVGIAAAGETFRPQLEGFGGVLLRLLIPSGLESYCIVVVMRQIGLFYRHFQDQIPWVVSEEKRREERLEMDI